MEAPETYTADDIVALMEGNVGEELSPEVGIQEEMVVEVMQELWKEINSSYSDQHNCNMKKPPPPANYPAASPDSFVVVGGDNERCGAVISAAESTVMAGVGVGPTNKYSGDNNNNSCGIPKLCCSCKMEHGEDKMDGSDGGESEDEWLTRVLSMDPQEFEELAVDLMVVDIIRKYPSHHHITIPITINSPETESPVPLDQQPLNEYQSLSADFVDYCSRLFVTGISFALFVGLPVSWYGSVRLDLDPLKRVLGAVSGGVFVATFVVVRMYLGWAYVGNRLLSATDEYEETGWYDGQIWVKTPEVLASDRLLGSYSVKPVLNRLKNTLVGLRLSLFLCIVLFVNTEACPKETYITSGEPGGRAVPGVYNDESARSFEPEAFCGEPGIH